ncbi:MAG TPA: D-2-hydroxyacid dehydrogenase [Dongiaceae bacterium]|jgi:phosphoglycerate dehydrogenase-like enzyme|nr:D-2-hydroxyacid dehydrogenase [Dongiaceae bacterium]
MRMIGFINPTLRQIESELLASRKIEFVVARSAAELREKIPGAEAVLVSNSTYSGEVAEILRAAPGLRWIQTASIGVENLLARPPRPGVVLTNAAGLKAPTVAEHAVALLLALARNVDSAVELRRAHRWAPDELAPDMRSLAGKNVLCLGYGAIGREVARKLLAFDAEVTALTRTGEGPPPATHIVPYGTLDAVLPGADAVVLALPLAPETRNVMSRARLARMKPTAFLVNVGRGELVDEAALAEALTGKRLGGAALDVFAAEPLAGTSPLWGCPRTIVSPHVAGQGGPGERLLARLIHENADRLKRGEPLANVVAVPLSAGNGGSQGGSAHAQTRSGAV